LYKFFYSYYIEILKNCKTFIAFFFTYLQISTRIFW